MGLQNYPNPPALADWLLARFCPPHLLEELTGDLHEQFWEQVAEFGESKARRLYWLEVIKFARPYFLKQQIMHQLWPDENQLTTNTNSVMLRNYFKIAFRTLWKSKGYSAINVVGLSVAFCICVFLLLTAYLQLTYDSFHRDGDRVFQTYYFSNDPEQSSKSGTMPMPLAPALKADFPELEAVTRVITGRKSLIEANHKYFDKLINYTDTDFLTVFSFPLVKGSRETALRDLSSIVISESMAKTVFGDADPMGKPLLVGSIGSQQQFIVSGVISDAPYNSTIQYDALTRAENIPGYQANKDNWSANFYSLFLKLPAQVDQASFENRLRPFVQKYYAAGIADLKKKGAQPDQRGDVFAIRLQKLADVHFNKEISNGRGIPVALVYALIGIASFILLIACINFINLNIARSFTRAREVGVRKSLGALRKQLFVQIWGESTLICVVGFLVGLLLTYLLLSEFNATFNTRLTVSHLIQPGFVGLTLCLLFLVTLIAGGYPAWQMTKFNAVEVLKGKVSLKRPGFLRNSLIVTQFAMSSVLACCTIIAAQQVTHLRTRPIGFDKEQVISIPVGNQVNGQQVLQRLRNKLANDPAVMAITGTGVNLGRGKDRVSSRSTVGFKYKGKDVASDWLLIDYDYFKTLNIKVVAGRDFSRTYATDSLNRVIITESMAKMLGEKNPVGLLLGDDADSTDQKSQVIGVVRDFHLYSVSDVAKPITMHISNSEEIRYIFVRVAPQNLATSMERLRQVWSEVAPQAEFMGSFLDENVDAWYQEEAMMTKLFSLASSIAILLSCMGLFAIALIVIEQRTKEIGIRKVMGASVAGIIVILSKDFVRLVVIALGIAIPAAWFLMTTWLDHYAERIEISPWVFIAVSAAAILIALTTISFQAIKAALVNPARSLRSE